MTTLSLKKFDFWKSKMKKKLPLFTVLLVTSHANNFFCLYLPHLANISNQNLASQDSKSIVHHFWTLLDGLEMNFFFSKTSSESRHFGGNGNTEWFDPSKPIPKFEFSKSIFFEKNSILSYNQLLISQNFQTKHTIMI